MGFGDSLKKLYQKASAAAQKAFHEIAKTAEEAKDKLLKGIDTAKEKVTDAYEYGKEKITDAYEYGKEKITDAYEYGKEKVTNAYEYGKQKVKEAIIAAKNAVDKVLKPQPAGALIQGCPGQTKAQRVKSRLQKINHAKDKLKNMPIGPDNITLAHATERLERNNYAVERGRLAKDTYNVGQGDPPEGWERVGKKEIEDLGINTSDFPQFKPGFRREKYKDDGFYPELYKSKPDVFGKEVYVLGFRGTQGKSDWIEGNAKQVIGLKSQHYENAKDITVNLQKALSKKGKALETTGHSLGGGLATAGAIVAGVPGFTFDTAGVHPATLERSGAFTRDQANKLIQNFYTEGEILAGVQDPVFQRVALVAGVVLAPVPAAIAVVANRATRENLTLTYGEAGPLYKLPALANAHEVADATSRGESIQGMTPGLIGRMNNLLNPRQKVELHHEDYYIAGMEQQKADDAAVIDHYLRK